MVVVGRNALFDFVNHLGSNMEMLLGALVSYMVSLAANESTTAIHVRREKRLKTVLDRKERFRRALVSGKSLQADIRLAAVRAARFCRLDKPSPAEAKLLLLLADEVFQHDLAEWLMAGAIAEGQEAKHRVADAMQSALESGGASETQIEFFKNRYFDAIDREVFSDPTLSAWRHQLSLDFLREQVAVLRRQADEAAGRFSAERQKEALERYCDIALKTWDIIDLSNLPEGDVQIATQALLLRQLYLPLRLNVEASKDEGHVDASLVRIERRRDRERFSAAGRAFDEVPHGNDPGGQADERLPIGQCLGAMRRLVVLGDPGAGKTTMLRWVATAYLFRRRDDPAFFQLPDTDTLPAKNWIPVLIRCRDLGEADLCRSFSDFVTQHLKKTELQPSEAEVMKAVVLDAIAKGEALLLIDGLDEITNAKVRMLFCQELERTAARYPAAPIVVTSRIVGYRDMPYRMGSGFVHGAIAELTRSDKILFARRWVDVTEHHRSEAERNTRSRELVEALHSSDRIERLTGNPMLLTTLALVKRKVGKLPSRRTKLYEEAVSVLLNWNPKLYEVIEEDEALPQLEYVAFEMCRRGVQRLTEDEILDLLDHARDEYRNIRALRKRESKAFLDLLEARSSILMKSGSLWLKQSAAEKPAWEFRHLTFQEYLAARALIDGRFAGRDKSKPLSEQIAPLAGTLETGSEGRVGAQVSEAWREALRLCIASCSDDDVDAALHSILSPRPDEDVARTARPRAALAAACLADEPNVSEDTAQAVLREFSKQVTDIDGSGVGLSPLARSGLEVGGSLWAPLLRGSLIAEFLARGPATRWSTGGLLAMIDLESRGDRHSATGESVAEEVVRLLRSGRSSDAIAGALAAMIRAFHGRILVTPGLVDGLLSLLLSDRHTAFAAAWAAGWLSERRHEAVEAAPLWLPNEVETEAIVSALDALPEAEADTARWLITVAGHGKSPRSGISVARWLKHEDVHVRRVAALALGRIGDKSSIVPLTEALRASDMRVVDAVAEALGELLAYGGKEVLLGMLGDPDEGRRQAALNAFARKKDGMDRTLLSREMNAERPWLDPAAPIDIARIATLAKSLGVGREAIRSRYEALATEYGLSIGW